MLDIDLHPCVNVSFHRHQHERFLSALGQSRYCNFNFEKVCSADVEMMILKILA